MAIKYQVKKRIDSVNARAYYVIRYRTWFWVWQVLGKQIPPYYIQPKEFITKEEAQEHINKLNKL